MQNRSPETEDTNGKGRVKERSKEGEYGWHTFYRRMSTEYLNVSKSPQEEY
jgi:hypothetical protein